MPSNYSSSRRGSHSQSGRPRGSKPSHSSSSPSHRKAPQKTSFFGKLLSFFGLGGKKIKGRSQSTSRLASKTKVTSKEGRPRTSRKPEPIEVTTPRLYVGNLSFDTSESDLFELFNGFGKVQNVELVCHRDTHRSKGFGFVQMTIIEEAKRAAEELHEKEYMGRKLVVSGARALSERAERSSQEAESSSNQTEKPYDSSSEEESCGSCCEH